MKKRKHRIWIEKILWAILLILLVTMFCIYKRGESLILLIEDWEEIDDQRATLWPVLVSIVVTMLGSLITTYVFLKEALDRTSDEKPYFREVIREYRNKSIHELLEYAKWSLFLMAVVIGIYCSIYFANWRFNGLVRLILVGLYIGCIIWSYFFLSKCIALEKGLSKTASELTEEIYRKLDDIEKKHNICAIVCNLKKQFGEDNCAYDSDPVRKWLQIEQWGEEKAGIREFINRFSEWEKLLLFLIEQSITIKGQNTYERIDMILQNMEGVPDYNVERKDAVSNRWSDNQDLGITGEVLEIEKDYLENISIEVFANIFRCLSDYRDLLRVRSEIRENDDKLSTNGNADCIVDFFFLFVVYLSVKIFRMLPKVEVFFPGGKFCFANFYNIRFESSAFRGSLFQNSVFARSHLINTNFGMSKFVNCEFYNMDSRNCSFANTYFRYSNFKEGIFEDADFTGAELYKCCLDQVSFRDAILSNMILDSVAFGKEKKEFSNCKIWNVLINNAQGYEIQNCDFSSSSLHDIRFAMDKVPGVKISENGQEDTIVLIYKQYLENYICHEKFWMKTGDEEKQNQAEPVTVSELRCMVRTFCAEGTGLPRVRIMAGKGYKPRIEEKPIWAVIKNNTVLSFKECVFSDADMPNSRFYRSDLSQCVFRRAVMNSACLISVYMPGCIMDGVNLRESILWAAQMQSAVLTGAILFQAVCGLVNLEDAALSGLHASEADISYCSFNRSDCSSIDLTKASVKDSSFADAILTNAELTGAEFVRVNFENSIADEMLSSYSLFRGCNLKNALLTKSSFNYTVFRNCSFKLANFENSTVTNVEFYNCDFKSSNFSNTCFVNARFRDCKNMKAEYFVNARFVNCC